jgi:hypothetical protein
MKEFYFSNGEKISKNEYNILKQNNASEKGINSIIGKSAEKIINGVTSLTYYDQFGNQFKYNENELNALKEKTIQKYKETKMMESSEHTPSFYCDKECVAIEIPGEYDYCKLSFIKGLEGKLLRMETPDNLFDYPINEFGKDPIEIKKNNGILIFK